MIKKWLRKAVIRPLTGRRGVTGLLRDGPGLVYEETLSELVPPEGLKVYRKMKWTDPIVGGLLLQLEGVMRRIRWRVFGPSREAVRLVEDMWSKLPGGLPGLVGEMATAFTYGFYVGEEIWKVDGRDVVLVDVEPRAQYTIYGINVDKGRVYQTAPQGSFEIPYQKCLHFVITGEARNPFGRSLLRHLYKPYYYKVAVEAAEGVGVDRDLSGLPVLRAPETFDFTAADSTSPNYDPLVEATLQWAVDLVTNVRKDKQQGVVLPHGWELMLLRSAGSQGMDTDRIVRRYNTEMCVGLLSGFLSGGMFASTNQANVEMHIQNYLYACDSWAITFAHSLTKLARKICRFNGVPEDELPKVEAAPARIIDLRDLAGFVARLVAQGVITPTGDIERALLSIVGLPYEEEGGNERRDTEEAG